MFVDPFPLYIDGSTGTDLIVVDGNRRLDFINNASMMILGRAHSAVVRAIREAARAAPSR